MKKFYCLLMVITFIFSSYANETDKSQRIASSFQSAKVIGVSIDTSPDEFVIAISPVRQTMQVIHSSARLVGALVSEVQNENYRKELEKVVGPLNGHILLRNGILETFRNKFDKEIIEVAPLGSTAQYKTDREAIQDRYAKLKSKGISLLLDLKTTCGIYGPDGEMFFKYTGSLYDLDNEKTLWRGSAVISPSVSMKVTHPFNTYFNPFKSNLFSPKLTISENALARWINNNGENFKTLQQEGISLLTHTLLGDLQLEDSESAYFGRGMSKLFSKQWKKAIPYLENAWEKSKKNPRIGNALMVALYKSKKIDEAIAIGEEVIKNSLEKEIATSYYNLCIIHLEKKKDITKASEYYYQYKTISSTEDPKLEKKLKKK